MTSVENFADDEKESYAMKTEIYAASKCHGVLDKLDNLLFEHEEDKAKEFLADIIDKQVVSVKKEQQYNGIVRYHLTSAVIDSMDTEINKVLQETHSNPLLNMWVDVADDGDIIDWERSINQKVMSIDNEN